MSLLIAAGGTGGHVFPALAVARAYRRLYPQARLYWVGTHGGREARWLSRENIPFYGAHIRGWQPKKGWKNLFQLSWLPVAAAEVGWLFRRWRIQGVFTTGGYPGLMPGLWSALLRKPLIILELNRHAGRTVRWLAPYARLILGAFPEIEGLPKEKAPTFLGVPVRFEAGDRQRYTPAAARQAWGLAPDRPVVLILGGSGGSTALNRAIAAALPAWLAAGAQVIWQVGAQPPAEVAPSEALRMVPFIEDMAQAYIAADLVVSRAGGATLGELAWWGKATVLVPSPHVAEDHQRKNAAYWAQAGAAYVVEEEDPQALAQAVLKLLYDAPARQALSEAAHRLTRPDSALLIAQKLHTLLYGVS
ncbi:MAG: UDP-N-acetylglucosamine--N-acetylmuramyl-(pentapeptide) pyrophosphoryl-undecaprenol N-acetylglucosamine transferase [Bacteroidia bacterium]